MNDFLGKPVAVGDTVVWRGPLTGNAGLKKAKVLKVNDKTVWIEVPHWWKALEMRRTCVMLKNVIKVDA